MADRPVPLFAIDAHSTWVTSETLREAGITCDTPAMLAELLTRWAAKPASAGITAIFDAGLPPG